MQRTSTLLSLLIWGHGQDSPALQPVTTQRIPQNLCHFLSTTNVPASTGDLQQHTSIRRCEDIKQAVVAERTYHLYANVSFCPPQCQYQNNMASLKRNALVVGYIRVKLTDISLQMIGYSFITKLHPLGSPDTLIWVLDCNLPFATALPIDDNLYP